MKCWNCGTPLDEPPNQKLSFRATCDHCSAWLHCCCNCKNYYPGLPNNCKIPGTEYIADRQAMNFCEEFAVLGEGPKEKDLKKDKDRFNSLFHDD